MLHTSVPVELDTVMLHTSVPVELETVTMISIPPLLHDFDNHLLGRTATLYRCLLKLKVMSSRIILLPALSWEESDPSLPPPSNPHASISPYQNLPGPSSRQSPVIIDSDSSEDMPSHSGKKDVLYEMFINSREKVDSMLELCSDDVNLVCQV